MIKKTLIIAEAGVNHNGDLEKAIALIDAAAYAGADYVKFQTFKAEKIVDNRITSVFAAFVPFRHQGLDIFQIFSWL